MKQRLTFITAGQSPRPEITQEILSHLDSDCDCDFVEVGALDDLSEMEIDELRPSVTEIGIATSLQNGRRVSLSENWLRQRIYELCENKGKTSQDITIIASTGVFDIGTTGEYVIHGQNCLDRLMEAMVISGQIVGKIFPLSRQPYYYNKKSASCETDAFAAPSDSENLMLACDTLKNCDLIVLNSMGYSETDQELTRKYSGKPVILVRRVLAGVVAKIIRQTSENSPTSDRLLQGSQLNDRLHKLTKRERQVFDKVISGLGNKDIGRNLGISHRTVEIHRARMLSKMGVSNSTDLMRLIMRNIAKASTLDPL